MSARRPRVVVTHWVHPEVAAYLAEFSDAVLPSHDEGVWPRSTVAALAARADALIACMADRVDEDFLAACPRLRVVSATLKGFDNFDADACARHGVWLTVVPGPLIPPTAELAVGLVIGLMRRVAAGDALVHRGAFAGWRPQLYGAALQGSTVGLIGLGELGQAIARRLAGFEARLVYHDARRLDVEAEEQLHVSFMNVTELAETADVLIVSLPLTKATCRMIDTSLLQRLRPGSFLVNVGRGSVVDEEAVATALEAGRLQGYASDVFALEDWALPGHPSAVPERLLRHPRTLFTPHLGSAVDAVRRAMSLEAARQVRQVFAGGQPDHAVSIF